MDNTKPTVPDYDLGDSAMPARPLRPLVPLDGAVQRQVAVLEAIAGALEAAVDIDRPHTTAGRCLTVQSMVKVAAEHPDRLPWLLSALDQLVRSWQDPDAA